MAYETILVETRGAIALITLNRPKESNALSLKMMTELGTAIDTFDANDSVGSIVITGNEKVFAAGIDIKEMSQYSYLDVYQGNFCTPHLESIRRCRKPVIAAVGGYALGGGNELALMCDLIIAADNAKFGQPEITLGTIPGSGGTQRLTRTIGKAKTMEMILTGRPITAQEAERNGIVSRVVPVALLLEEACKLAEQIAEYSQPIVMMAKEAINRAYETTLEEGIRFEQRLFYATFATQDQKEGMAAFIEKRQPNFKHS